MGIVNYGDFAKALDNVRQKAPNGQEYWMGRTLQGVLNYARWENFEALIERPKRRALIRALTRTVNFAVQRNSSRTGEECSERLATGF